MACRRKRYYMQSKMGQKATTAIQTDNRPGEGTTFPFLCDEKTLEVLKNFNIMLILRGLPGSGKSTLANEILKIYPNAQICSADKYFQKDGKYQFNKAKLKDAHESCQTMTQQLCSEGFPVVIVDNTNITLWEMKPYFRIASKYSYIMLVIEPQTSWKFIPEELARKNTHKVPMKVIRSRLGQYDKAIPIYYGLFLSEKDSFRVFNLAGQVYQSCLNLPLFISVLCNVWMDINYKDPFQYFIKPSSTLHCTTKFCAKGSEPGSREYFEQKIVQESCGKSFRLKVVGFVITPRTFSARVKLGEQELLLWGQNDLISENNKITIPVTKFNSTAILVTILGNLTLNDVTSVYTNPNLKLSRTILSPLKPTTFQPTVGVGRRAHLTLGCAAGIRPVQSGFDQLQIINFEEEMDKTQNEIQTFIISEGILRFYGNACWAVFLDIPLSCDCIFAGYY